MYGRPVGHAVSEFARNVGQPDLGKQADVSLFCKHNLIYYGCVRRVDASRTLFAFAEGKIPQNLPTQKPSAAAAAMGTLGGTRVSPLERNPNNFIPGHTASQAGNPSRLTERQLAAGCTMCMGVFIVVIGNWIWGWR